MFGLGLLAFLALVLANAFFVLGEFALITVDRGRLEEMADAGDGRAAALLGATAQLTRHLSAAQLVITLSSLLIGCVSVPLVACVIHPLLGVLTVPEATLALSLSVASAVL